MNYICKIGKSMEFLSLFELMTVQYPIKKYMYCKHLVLRCACQCINNSDELRH